VAKTMFETIGCRLGQKAAQAKNAFDLMGGTEEDSLRAEIRLGRDLASALLERIPLVEENEATRFATQIGLWLAASVKEKKLPFKPGDVPFCESSRLGDRAAARDRHSRRAIRSQPEHVATSTRVADQHHRNSAVAQCQKAADRGSFSRT